MSLEQTVAAIAAAYGADYTVRRVTSGAGPNAWTAGAETIAYMHARGRERNAEPKALRGGMSEAETLIVLDAASCPTQPRKGDRIALGRFTADAGAEWRQIVNVVAGREGAHVRVWRVEATR
jgi:glutamate synthase domain-containing protein 1